MNSVTVEFIDGTTVEVQTSPSIDQVINGYAKVTGVRMDDLVGPSKVPAITGHRHELMYLIRRLDPSASFSLIGRFIGGRDMATVHEAIAKVEQRLQRDVGYAASLAALARQIVLLAQEGSDPSRCTAKPWRLTAAVAALRDKALTDAEARKVALLFLERAEVTDV